MIHASKSKIWTTALMLAAGLGAGCAHTAKTESAEPAKTATNTDLSARQTVLQGLNGRYQAKPDTEISRRVGGIGCTVKEVSLSGDEMTLKEVNYADRNCRGKVLGEIWTKGDARLGHLVENSPQTYQLNMAISSVQIVPRDAEWARVFTADQSGECKLSKMSKNKPHEVAGLDCRALGKFPAKGKVFYSTIKLNADRNLETTQFPYEAPAAVGVPDERLEATNTTFFRL